MEILIRPLHRRYAAEPPQRGSQVKGNKYSLPLGGKVLSECEANEGRSTFLIEILYRNFQSRGVACCFILSSFSIMKLPLDFQKFFVKNIQKIKNGLRPSSPPLRGRASPRGEATKWLTIFAEKMKFAEFFSGKGKP
ncbi:MAG: hypothetical protein ACLTKZ_07725 [Lachnospiraceae bacterium]